MSKACFKCGSLSHFSAKCPNKENGKVTCFKCGKEGHYSDKCPNGSNTTNVSNYQKQITCFSCGKIGHFKDQCPNLNSSNSSSSSSSNSSSSSSSSSSTITESDPVECFHCKKPGHYKNECPILNRFNSEALNILATSNYKINATIKLNGMWGKSSAYVDTECVLSKLKSQIIASLVEEGILQESDIDERNLTSHIDIDSSPAKYDKINESKILISIKSFKIQQNIVLIELIDNMHFTIVWKKDISNHMSKIITIINTILDKNTHGIDPSKLCTICYEHELDTLIQPCNHLCICSHCSPNIRKCPICRGEIQNKVKVFITSA